jgi:putative ATP-dependent endonuclease of OLD family
VFQVQAGAIGAADLKRLDHHVRRHRGGILFAKVWILVEGETDETVIQEVARIRGRDLFGEGICCFKFTELGVELFIRLAEQFGIHWIVVADGDPAGNGYVATAQGLLNGRTAADHIRQLPAWDIETYLCINGYGHLYQATISPQMLANAPNPHAVGTADYWQHVVNQLQPKKGKPTRILPVIDAIEAAGAPAVPAYLTQLIDLALLKAQEGA